MPDWFVLLRPHQWLKNFFIFAPLFFAGFTLDLSLVIPVAYTFVVFSFVASAGYVLNDLIDCSRDREHPQKKERPIASGAVSRLRAFLLMLALLVVAGVILYIFIPRVAPVIGGYFLIQILYSTFLKQLAVIDLLTISFMYLLRVLAGGVVIDLFISKWLILCMIFLSLFLIIAKRKAELERNNGRVVLRSYTVQLLDTLLVIALTMTLVAYSLYTVLGIDAPLAVYSIFFVMFGMFRYLMLAFQSRRTEYPEFVFFSDLTILGSVVAWILFMFFIIYPL